MRLIEGIDQVVTRLKPHWTEINSHFEHENSVYKELFAASHDTLGRVLKCHLLIEHYLDRFLKGFYQLGTLDQAHLTFAQKAKLLPLERSAAAFVRPGILNLNRVRNDIGHSLNAQIDINDLGGIIAVLRVAYSQRNFELPVEAIEAFTPVACSFLIVAPPSLQQVFMEAFADISVADTEG